MTRLFLVVAFLGCSNPDPIDHAVEEPGPDRVATTRFTIHDAVRSRDLIAQAWYPTDAMATDAMIESIEISPVRERYAGLLATAPAECPSRSLAVAIDAPPSSTGVPLVLLSHCHACTRLSNATTAIRLASHGFAVVAVEHAGDTLWERLDGMEADIDTAELELRTADLRFTLDQIVAGATPVGGIVDLSRVGVLGHSMGAVTAGRVAQTDPRIKAAAALCAPMENPFVPGVSIAEITVPLMFVVAVEDNSITEFGNKFIRDNFAAAATAVKVEIPDAGHWSVSDLDGLVDLFSPGCGAAQRQTDGNDFTYLDPASGRAIAAAYATAFFQANLLDDAAARGYVEAASDSFGVALLVEHHP